MKKFNKILTVLVAFAMIVSSLTMLAIHDEHAHVHAEETPAVGTVYTITKANIGTTNVNGQFAFKVISRVAPVVAESDNPSTTNVEENDPQSVWNNWKNSQLE